MVVLNLRLWLLLPTVALAMVSGRPAAAQIMPSNPVKIMALGDSITRGSGSGYGNYRRPLQFLLTQGGYSYQFVGTNTEQSFNYHGDDPGQTFAPYQPGHEGYGGFRIDQIASSGQQTDDGGVSYPGLRTALVTDAPGIVLLLIGTNDITQGYDPGGPGYGGSTGFAADAAQRLNLLVGQVYTNYPGVTVVLASLTPLINPASDSTARAYNAYIPDLVSRYQNLGDSIRFADMHTAFGSDASLISSDGIHPSTAGYDRMAQTWYGALTAAPEPHTAVTMSCGFLILFIFARVARRRTVQSEAVS